MVCRETVYINPKLFVILGMALIILSTELRQKLQEGEIKDKIRVFPFIWLIGIPALIVSVTMGVASKHYGDDKM